MRRKTLEEQLRQAIHEWPETEYAIAKGAGVAQAILSRFTSGERTLTLKTADKLAAYLGLSLKP